MKRILTILLTLVMVLTFTISTSAATINNTGEIEIMEVREIPAGSVEIQTGLWLYEYQRTINGTTYTIRHLYSAEGYCFYDLIDEYYDEEGNLIPEEQVQPNQRIYYQYMGLANSYSTWTHEQLNAQFISVPVQDGYEIVSVGGNNHVTE